jgi:isopenicillin N synthase-like dioxygenase
MQRRKFNLRPIHYLQLPLNLQYSRAAAHGDINLITLLMGAQGKGYKFKTTTVTGLMRLLNQMN